MCMDKELVELKRAAKQLEDALEHRDIVVQTKDAASADARLANANTARTARVLFFAVEDLIRAVNEAKSKGEASCLAKAS